MIIIINIVIIFGNIVFNIIIVINIIIIFVICFHRTF